MRPVCVTCQTEMKCDKNGVAVLEMIPVTDGPPEPYRLWHADRYRCEGCGQTVLVGFGKEPLCYAHNAKFDEYVAAEAIMDGPVFRLYPSLADKEAS